MNETAILFRVNMPKNFPTFRAGLKSDFCGTSKFLLLCCVLQ